MSGALDMDMGADASDPARVRARLLALLNHDLRAPLARIAAQACSAAPDLQAIAGGARRQLEWLSDVQDCARFEVRPPELTPAPAYLHALLRQSVDEARIPSSLPALALLDARLLAQALRKLRGHAARPVTSHAVVADDMLTLSFSTGDDHQEDAWNEVAGSLADDVVDPGLMLAAHLVRAMGGRLLQAGDSLRFEITTPLADEDEAMPPAPRFDLPQPFGGGHAVLLLEPHDAMRDYLSEILESAGFEVLDDVKQGRPALVLCADESLWEMLPRDAAPPVLLHALLPPRRPLDFACVLYKPASPDALLDALRRLLDGVSAPAVRR
jgi:hypothetical protein